MMIGANDLFLLVGDCASSPDPNCVAGGFPQMLATLGGNLETIYSSLRQAGFGGTFVAVTYYSSNYADTVGTAAIAAIDAVLAQVTQAFGGKVADGFGAFERAAKPFAGDSCAAGLLIHLTPTTCDVHPSPAGAALLAQAFRDAV
jgi:hypothetical protein